jgi:hypothetical protein
MGEILPFKLVRDRLLVLRGQRVMLSSDLAELYGVPPRALAQAVKRNADRFPDDFMFRLTRDEWVRLMTSGAALGNLKSQTVTSRLGHGGQRKVPLAFTEQGIAMLSSVLKSKQAIQVNIEIMRAFGHIRRWLISHRELGERIEALEKKVDGKFKIVFQAIDVLSEPPPSPPPRRIGLRVP